MWRDALQKFREREAELEGERRDELLRVDPQCRPFASKIHHPLLRETMIGLKMGDSEWVVQFLAGFPITGSVSEAGARPRKFDPPPPISRPEPRRRSSREMQGFVCLQESPLLIPVCGKKL